MHVNLAAFVLTGDVNEFKSFYGGASVVRLLLSMCRALAHEFTAVIHVCARRLSVWFSTAQAVPTSLIYPNSQGGSPIPSFPLSFPYNTSVLRLFPRLNYMPYHNLLTVGYY